MELVTKSATNSSLVLNFTKVDSVYDYLVSVGMRPVVELSWMPAALAINPKAYVWCYKGIDSPPKSVSQWGDMVGAMGAHFVARHGVDEVAQWAWELWNEPNCSPCKVGQFQTRIESQIVLTHAFHDGNPFRLR